VEYSKNNKSGKISEISSKKYITTKIRCFVDIIEILENNLKIT